MEEKIKKLRDLNPAEVDAMIQDILEDTDIQSVLEEIGMPLGEIYTELTNETAIVAGSEENEGKYAKRFLKNQVIKYLMSKRAEKYIEEEEATVNKQVKKLMATEEQQKSYRTGNVGAIMKMIKAGFIIGADGKTVIELSETEKKEFLKHLKLTYGKMVEILNEFEMEVVEEVSDDLTQEAEPVSNKQPEDIVLDSKNETEVGEPEIDASGEIESDNVPTMEDYNFRRATETEKSNILKQNQESAENYRNVTFYMPPENLPLNEIARRIIDFQKNNPNGEKIVVSYFGHIIDPQKFTTVEQIVEDVKREFETNYDINTEPANNNSQNKIKEYIDGVTHDIMSDNKRNAEYTPITKDMIEEGKGREIIKGKEEPVVGEQEADDNEHPFPERPGERE